ncbi:MAG: hypothetical protein ACXWYS_06840, partial [Gaiellaceae bacterium]
HGQEQQVTVGGRSVLLFPLYHPAAALYTPAMLKVLEADFARLPALLGAPAAPDPDTPTVEDVVALLDEAADPSVQLGLF